MEDKIECPLCGFLMRRIAMDPDGHGHYKIIYSCPSCKNIVHITK